MAVGASGRWTPGERREQLMIRRLAVGAAGAALGIVAMVGPVAAQDSPASVLPTVVERPQP